jgi:hypothetical protein
MKNAFLSFLESFASSRSAAVLDRNRDAFFVKGRAKLISDVSLRRPQTPNRRSARRLKRVSASFGFPIVRIDSTKSKVFTFFSNSRKFYKFFEKNASPNVPSTPAPRFSRKKAKSKFTPSKEKRSEITSNNLPRQNTTRRRSIHKLSSLEKRNDASRPRRLKKAKT